MTYTALTPLLRAIRLNQYVSRNSHLDEVYAKLEDLLYADAISQSQFDEIVAHTNRVAEERRVLSLLNQESSHAAAVATSEVVSSLITFAYALIPEIGVKLNNAIRYQ